MNLNSFRSSDIDYNLITHLVEHIVKEEGSRGKEEGGGGGKGGGILIFLPGVSEIHRCLSFLSDRPLISSSSLLLPLHSLLSPAEQRHIFKPAPGGLRKIVAATNIAESSITVEEVDTVIDTGRGKKKKKTRKEEEMEERKEEEDYFPFLLCTF